jgi:hypothetical protein
MILGLIPSSTTKADVPIEALTSSTSKGVKARGQTSAAVPDSLLDHAVDISLY